MAGRPPLSLAAATAAMAAMAAMAAIGPCAFAAPASVPASAACSGATLAVLAASAEIAADGSAPAAQACRVWPHDPGITLATVAYPRAGSAEPGDRALRLAVAMLDSDDGRLLASHHMDVEEDAGFRLGAGGLRLDTARYDLAPGLRAFGVVVRSSAPGPSCPDGRVNDELTLYLREGAALRPVFSTYLETWQRVEGEPCAWARGERVVTEQAASVVAVEPTSSHGHADLRVIAKVERSVLPAGRPGRDGEATQRRASQVVRHDGRRYDTAVLQNGFFWGVGPVEE